LSFWLGRFLARLAGFGFGIAVFVFVFVFFVILFVMFQKLRGGLLLRRFLLAAGGFLGL
jgi:hypothetical protein